MESDEVTLVQNACEDLLSQSTALTRHFFNRLRDLDPALPFVREDLSNALTSCFITTLATVISELRNPDRILPLLTALSEQYCRPQTMSDDLGRVRTALTWAVQRSLGPNLTASLEKAWHAGCDMLIAEMIASVKPTGAVRCSSSKQRSEAAVMVRI